MPLPKLNLRDLFWMIVVVATFAACMAAQLRQSTLHRREMNRMEERHADRMSQAVEHWGSTQDHWLREIRELKEKLGEAEQRSITPGDPPR